jgi:hypothetical protein
MARPRSVRVPESILVELFEALSIWKKVARGTFTEVAGSEPSSPARARWCPEGVSRYSRIVNSAGRRIARVHYLDCPGIGTFRFPSYLEVGDVRIYRIGHDD